MGSYLKMQITDKENLCQNIYRDEILKSADYLKEFEAYAAIGKQELNVACYTNFRDALFHFRKMVECTEEHEITQQAFAVREHLHRARTDAKTDVLFFYAGVVNRLITEKTLDRDIKLQLEQLLHKMKNVVMMSRMNGLLMSDTAVNEFQNGDVSLILEEFFDLINEKIFNQFFEVVSC